MSDGLHDVFRAQLKWRAEAKLKAGPAWQENGLLFCMEDGTPYVINTMSAAARKARDLAGVPPNSPIHGLRHAFATIALSKGVNAKHIQALMRHSHVSTTLQLYTDVYDDDLADIAGMLDRTLRGDGVG